MGIADEGTAAEILKQDRANYHRFGKRDAEDQTDTILNTSESRSKAVFRISKTDVSQILKGNPLVRVTKVGGVYMVEVIRGGEE